jgi:hypothetical protein
MEIRKEKNKKFVIIATTSLSSAAFSAIIRIYNLVKL